MSGLALFVAGALLATGPVTAVPSARPEPEAPASLDRPDVMAWMAKNVKSEDWTLLAYDTEGVKLFPPKAVAKTPEGLAETDVRTELFRPIAVSAGVARSGLARWSVDCDQGLIAVTSMTVYAGNNLQGEFGRRITEGRVWQSPVGAEFDAIREVCKAIGVEAKLGPMPEAPPR